MSGRLDKALIGRVGDFVAVYPECADKYAPLGLLIVESVAPGGAPHEKFAGRHDDHAVSDRRGKSIWPIADG
jgi:hypothetical protein